MSVHIKNREAILSKLGIEKLNPCHKPGWPSNACELQEAVSSLVRGNLV